MLDIIYSLILLLKLIFLVSHIFQVTLMSKEFISKKNGKMKFTIIHSIPIVINPLVTDQLYIYIYGKKFDLKKKIIIEKNSYELRTYESVDEKSLS